MISPAMMSILPLLECDDNTVYNNTSPSSSVPVKPQASDVIENESVEIETENRMDLVEHSAVTYPNGNHSHEIGIEPAVISKRSPNNIVYEKTSASASMPVELPIVEVAETSDIN